MGAEHEGLEGGPGERNQPSGGEALAEAQVRPRVRLEVFEGPLDLLLHLIKKHELDITDIPIAAITEQYLAYLDLMRELNLDIAGEFLVMAATLLLIKSQTLLPEEARTDEEDEGEDLRADLVRRLLEYERYREAAAALAERPLLFRDVFARDPAWDPELVGVEELPWLRVSLWELLEALRRVLARAREVPLQEVSRERVSVRDRVRFVLDRLSGAGRLDFEELFPQRATRLEIIVTFLAILELARLRAVRIVQEAPWGPIAVRLEVEDPSAVRFEELDEYEACDAGGSNDGGRERT